MAAASIFNGYVLTHALFALWELGLADRLAADGGLKDVEPGVAALLEPLTAAGLLSDLDATEKGWRLTPAGAEVLDEIGFFVWAVGGYGEVFRNAAGITAGRQVYGPDVRRDDRHVVTGSALAARRNVLPHVHRAVDRLRAQRPVRRVVDVGCGNAGLLVELCRRHPGLTGVGIDISPTACALARDTVRRAGLQDRITVSCASFQSSTEDGPSVWRDADLVTSFFMLHDLMGDRERAVADLRALRERLPTGARLLIADTVYHPPGAGQPPIFTLGYQLAHALMGVRLWSTADYEKVFAAAGLTVVQRLPTGAPSTWLYLLC